MNTIWFSLLPFTVFFAWFFIGRARRSCPNCGRSLPRTVSPFRKTRRQWLEGGWVCSHCGCEVNSAGEEVVAATAQNRRAMTLQVSLVAMVTALAVILLLLVLAHPHS
jgi:hypothetical protein